MIRISPKVLYLLFFVCLLLQPDESSGQVSWKRSEYPGDLRAAMSVAMRPAGAAAAAREPHIRAVEPGGVLHCHLVTLSCYFVVGLTQVCSSIQPPA